MPSVGRQVAVLLMVVVMCLVVIALRVMQPMLLEAVLKRKRSMPVIFL
jgi:hypothetical protein